MEKRIFLAVLISIGFLWIWAAVAPKLFPELARKPAPAAAAKSTSTAGAAAPASSSSPAKPPAAAAPVPATAPIAAAAVRETAVDTPEFTAVFSNRGAQLVSFRLKRYKGQGGEIVELVKARDQGRIDFPFALELRDPAATRQLNAGLYELTQREEGGRRVLEYRYSDGRTTATKVFKVGREFQFDFSVGVAPAQPYRVVIGPGIRTLGPDEKDSQFIVTGNGVVEIEEKLTVVQRKDAVLASYPGAHFVGVEDNYFLSAIKPSHGGEAVIRSAEFRSGKEARREIYAGVNAAADGVVSGQAFFGPKQTKILEAYDLDSTLQFGWFGFIARMFLEVLLWINGMTKNFGWAIVVLTIIIKIVLYPLQHKSIVSMKRMQKVQPKVEAIKNKYKKARTDPEQRQKMNVEMMKLYQQEGINPMGGCLPILLQLPIFWGFYGLLSRAIELRGAPYMLWIQDLSAKDPYYITPILMTVTMFIQTAITPSTADPMQKRIFLIMPLIFGWIFKEFPSGLVLYWLVQNILTIIQQMIMNKYWHDHPEELQKD